MPRCPGCFIPMTRLEEEGIRSCVCQQCFGRWIPNSAMHRRVRLDTQLLQAAPQTPVDPFAGSPVMQESLEDLIAIVAESNTKTPLRCPTCENPMSKIRFHQMIPVQIDRCQHCDTLWLDTGEYALIRRLYVEMLTSTDPRVIALREKIAGARLEWDAHERALVRARENAGPNWIDSRTAEEIHRAMEFPDQL